MAPQVTPSSELYSRVTVSAAVLNTRVASLVTPSVPLKPVSWARVTVGVAIVLSSVKLMLASLVLPAVSTSITLTV